MSRPIKNITLNEGFNDLGTHQIEVTEFEFPNRAETILANSTNQPKDSWQALFAAVFTTGGAYLQRQSKVEYTVYAVDSEIEQSGELFLDSTGVFAINVPRFQFVKENADSYYYINLIIEGEYTSRSEELFLEVKDSGDNTRYTPFTNLITDDNRDLGVRDKDENFYKLSQNISINASYNSLLISSDGKIFYFDDVAEIWKELAQLTFTQFADPSALIFDKDGIYEYDAGAGAITTGNLEESSTSFENFSAKIESPVPDFVSVELDIYEPFDLETPVYSGTIHSVLPGSLDFNIVAISGSPSKETDDSPTLGDIETVSGTTFSSTLKNFLTTEKFDTLFSIRKAGPLLYIKNFPASGWTQTEVDLLQSHVDLYTINEDIDQNQHLIDNDYGSLYNISITPRNEFIADVSGATIGRYKSAEVHELTVQNQKMTGNLLAARMTDYSMDSPVFTPNPDSDFADEQFASFINKCDCDECNSAVSPFAYLVDLLKYGAKHIRKTTTTTYNPTDYNAFITLLENYFLQPFGSLAVSCDTLHEEFCRVRLVTEILEQYVDNQTLPQPVLDKLAADRKNYLMLTYQTILTEAGTSLQQLRDVYATQPNEDKIQAATALTERIGIPLYISGTSNFTVDRMWLTFGNSDPNQELDAENLETIFGFRDTQRDVLLPTPQSLMEQWRAQYLRDQWKAQDYPFTVYSREDASTTIKTSWKPIIDPDIIGMGDFTYLTSSFVLDLWRHRKDDTDTFLDDIISDSGVVSRTSADLTTKVLKVVDRDISTDVIEDDEIKIENPSNSTFEAFEVLSKSLNGMNTDIILKKPTTPTNPMFQPDGTSPTMRFNKVLNVQASEITEDNPTNHIYTITFSSPVLTDVLSGGVAKLISILPDTSVEEFKTSDGSIESITFDSNETEVELDLDAALSQDFLDGTITFVYEVEVPLYTSLMADPEKICIELFDNTQRYDLLSPYTIGGNGYVDYYVWTTPPQYWHGIDPNDTNTYFENLKILFNKFNSGSATSDQLGIISDNLNLNNAQFVRMMELMIACEKFLSNTFSVDKPTEEDLYNLASVFRMAGKTQLDTTWVQEEIEYDGGSGAEDLKLSCQFFWKSIKSPQEGPWNPSLQTIPTSAGSIDNTHTPIIDPELVAIEDMVNRPDTQDYITLYDTRKTELNDQYDIYFGYFTSEDSDAFTKILNYNNQDDPNTNFSLAPEYSAGTPAQELDLLIADFQSNDALRIQKATDKLMEAFGFTAEAFEEFLPIKESYEDPNGTELPSNAKLQKAASIGVTGFKINQLYPTVGMDKGWIEEEVDGSQTGSTPVKYYNVLKLNLSPVRGNLNDRIEWQRTLEAWNSHITINPDIVPPENINEFISGETVYDIWDSRKGDIDTLRTTLEGDFNDQETDTDLLNNIKDWINMAVARSTDTGINTPPREYLPYFEAIGDMEDLGIDIRPYIDQLGFTYNSYRTLDRIYNILVEAVAQSNPSNLIQSEFDDIIDIFIRVRTATIWAFDFKQEEFDNDVLLSGDDFQNFKESPVNFPLTITEEHNPWRSPVSLRNYWKQTLETRIDAETTTTERWKDILVDVEEVSMPVLRDALINALRLDCESLEQAAERLAQTLFIETQDNCCVKHSRVSHAFETLQGLIFSLENGVYNDYLDGFSLVAPNFDREWEWLGSYKSWRSAVFTFIFPENLLYPTLKRLQSPAFQKLAKALNNANRLNPNDACALADQYEEYFKDIQNLNIICNTDTQSYVKNDTPYNCCNDDEDFDLLQTSFYFAQSSNSGKFYWSRSIHQVTPNSEHTFWEELNLRTDATVLGCAPVSTVFDSTGIGTNRALYLFYTYKDEGELKMAFIKKDISQPNTEWEEEFEVDLPSTVAPSATYSIKMVQTSHEWDYLSFVFSIGANSIIETFIPKNESFEPGFSMEIVNTYNYGDLKYALKYTLANSNNTVQVGTVALIFENKIVTKIQSIPIYSQQSNPSPLSPSSNTSVSFSLTKEIDILYEPIGAFLKTNTENKLVVVSKSNSQRVAIEYEFIFNQFPTSEIIVNTTNLTFDNNAIQINEIYPRFRQFPGQNYTASNIYDTRILIGGGLDVAQDDTIRYYDPFNLAPDNTFEVPVASIECITDPLTRTNKIKQHIQMNLAAPAGNPVGNYHITPQTKEYLYEAYYFVPMLLALKLQQKKEFDAALDWYRSVYDYTQDVVSNRKIFYGLVLEQSISNIYQRPADWLLDPLNPHLIAQTRANAYTKYTITNIAQCLIGYGDREFTMDTVESVPRARKLYTEAQNLLNVGELRAKPKECLEIALNCMADNVSLPLDRYWNNNFVRLQREVLRARDISTTQSLADEVESIFDNGGLTIEEKFSDAFDYVRTNLPDPPSPDDVTQLIDGTPTRMDNAYRYLISDITLNNLNGDLAGAFNNTVARISSRTPEEVVDPANEDMIKWLTFSTPDNKDAASFSFANTSTGEQLLPADSAFNPLSPTRRGYNDNLTYSNAESLIHTIRYPFRDFSPFIDYSFCIPTNPVYSSLELKTKLELYKIHNCRNIAGMLRELDIYAAPTDTTTGVPYIGASGNLILPGLNNYTPSQYRFRVLIERAQRLTNQAQQLESQFLSALEKYDAESYSRLRAQQDLQTAKATVRLQDLRVRKANKELSISQIQLAKAQFTVAEFSNRLAQGLNGYETASLALLQTAVVFQGIATAGYVTEAGFDAATFNAGGSAEAFARSFGSIADTLRSQANIIQQMASYQRRKEEWQFQQGLAGFDVGIANQQIKIAEDNIRIVSQERKIAELNTDHAEDTLEFLRNKFTNAELYNWMSNVLERSYSYMLNLSTAVAKSAEGQLYFEQQEPAGPFIQDDYWETAEGATSSFSGEDNVDRRGLTGSARLLVDITKLEQYAFETTKRKLQMTKTISLAQNFPTEFQTFKDTGVMNYELTNKMFDYDFPGQYLRLVKGVKVTVVGLTPVYDGIKATLTAGNTSYTVVESNGTFQKIPVRRMETDQIALTSPAKDNGLFEMQPMQNELLNPFEGMGVESRWEFKMPKFSNRMDFSQIADVIIEVDYNAFEDYQYKYQVLQELNNNYSFNRGFSFKNDFADQWFSLANAQPGEDTFGVTFKFERSMFPRGIDNIRIDESTPVYLKFIRKDSFEDEIHTFYIGEMLTSQSSANFTPTTNNGLHLAGSLATVLSNSLYSTLELQFDNTPINRELFSEENVTDIILLIGCKGDIPGYPL